MDKKLVIVQWRDAADPDESKVWYTEEELDKFGDEDVIITSVGWVKSNTKLYITLVADTTPMDDGTHTYGRPTKIPHGMVVGIKELDILP